MKTKISRRLANIILLLCFLSLLISIVYGFSLVVGFLSAIIITLLILKVVKYPFKSIYPYIKKDLASCKDLYIVILLIGGIVSMWLESGVVPAMIFYGLKLLNGPYLLPIVFLLTGIISYFMGTAIGTISTIGIAIVGIGEVLGYPMHILLAATISGAFISDKIAPISGLLNLTLRQYNLDYKSYLKVSLKTMLPAVIVTTFMYLLLDVFFIKTSNGSDNVNFIIELSEVFNISLFLLAIPLVVLLLSLKGTKTYITLGTGIILSGLVNVFWQNNTIVSSLKTLLLGCSLDSNYRAVNTIIKGGGIVGMFEVVIIVMSAIGLTSILENAQIINPIITKFVKNINSKERLILKTQILSSLLTILTCDQTVGIILPNKVLKDKYKKFGIKNEVFARTISDSGTIIAPLMPWNVNAIIIYAITGISAIDYGPYVFFCWVVPVVSYVVAKIENKKVTRLK